MRGINKLKDDVDLMKVYNLTVFILKDILPILAVFLFPIAVLISGTVLKDNLQIVLGIIIMPFAIFYLYEKLT